MSALRPGTTSTCLIPMEKFVEVCTLLHGLSVKSCGGNAQNYKFEHSLLSDNAS